MTMIRSLVVIDAKAIGSTSPGPWRSAAAGRKPAASLAAVADQCVRANRVDFSHWLEPDTVALSLPSASCASKTIPNTIRKARRNIAGIETCHLGGFLGWYPRWAGYSSFTTLYLF
jgi:hypothetical protein